MPSQSKPIAHPLREPLGRHHRVAQVICADLVEVARVVARDHQGVPSRPRVDVHERDGLLVLVDPLRGQLARHDLAEDAVFAGHGEIPYRRSVALLDQTELRAQIERLAAIERPSASPGEAQAARLIADELGATGAEARLEEEEAHGTYWWPIGLLTGAAALAGVGRGRLIAAVTGLLAAGGVVDDISGGSQWFRRKLLPKRTTTNVVAEVGAADAIRTVVVVSHHDAAHSGLVFHPNLLRAVFRRFPRAGREDGHDPRHHVELRGRSAHGERGSTAWPAPRAQRRVPSCRPASRRPWWTSERGGWSRRQRQPHRRSRAALPGPIPARRTRRRRSGDPAVNRLRGVLHGRDAGVRPAPLRAPFPLTAPG